MRSQWCREHIEKTAEECGLEKSVVSDVKQAAKFCAVVSDLSECSTRSILALIRIKDEPVKNRAISLAINTLKEETPTGGKKHDRLTELEIKKLIDRAEREIRGELTKKYEQEKKDAPKKPSYNSTPQKGDFQTDEPAATDIVIGTGNGKPIHKQKTPEVVGKPKISELPAPGREAPTSIFSCAKYFDKIHLSEVEKNSFTNQWARKCLSKEQKETLQKILRTGEFESNLHTIGVLIERAGAQLDGAA
jgi:hypothetical protein